MRRKGPEGKITDAIIAYLRSRPKTWCVKIAAGPFQSAGLPDVIGCDFGRFFAFEVKQPGKTATPLQSAVLAAIRRAGGIAEVATSVEQARVALLYEIAESDVDHFPAPDNYPICETALRITTGGRND